MNERGTTIVKTCTRCAFATDLLRRDAQNLQLIAPAARSSVVTGGASLASRYPIGSVSRRGRRVGECKPKKMRFAVARRRLSADGEKGWQAM